MVCRILACLLSFILIGCAHNLPVDIWIDDNFSPEEERAIINAMDNWEKSTGADVFNYKGRYVDNRFDFVDLMDRHHIIYKLVEPTLTSKAIEDVWTLGHGKRNIYLVGFGPKTDVLIYWYNLSKIFGDRKYGKTKRYVLWRLENLATHELGHFLGLKHSDNEESIMCLHRRKIFPNSTVISLEDVRNFCRLYICP